MADGNRENKTPGNRVVDLVGAELVVRTVYLTAVLIGLPAGTLLVAAFATGGGTTGNLHGAAPLYEHTVLSPFPASPYWMLVLVLSLAAALLGPKAYGHHRDRGRGQLAQIRAISRSTTNPVPAPKHVHVGQENVDND